MSSVHIPNGSFSSLAEDLIYVQINNYDTYQEFPGEFDRQFGNSLPEQRFAKVPIIRIYGSLPSGHNILCHIHGAYPYIFVSYDGKNNDSIKVIESRCSQLHSILERSLKESYARKGSDKKDELSDDNTLKYIADVSPVRGVPFYGYHRGYQVFYKISLLNQSYTAKLSDLLREGKATGKKAQVYEAHIPFLLQFSTDYNLFGCSWLKLTQCYFRVPVLNSDYSQDTLLRNNELDTFLERFCKDDTLSSSRCQRMGNTLLEVDIMPQHIENRQEIEHRDIHSVLFEKSQDIQEETLFIPSTKELWTQTALLRKEFALPPYKPVSEQERASGFPKWQGHDELMSFLEKAKACTSKRSRRKNEKHIPKAPSSASDQLDLPNQALIRLWPHLKTLNDRILSSSSAVFEKPTASPPTPRLYEQEKVESIGSDTSLSSHSIPGSPAEVEDGIVEKRVVSSNKTSQSTPASESQGQLNPSFSDRLLTQSLMKKRGPKKLTLVDEAPRKIRKLHSGITTIPVSSEAFRYKSFHLDYLNILSDIEDKGIPKIDYRDPYFETPQDLKKKDHIYSGRKFNLHCTHVSCRRPIEVNGQPCRLESDTPEESTKSSWKYALSPPSYNSVQEQAGNSAKPTHRSQIDFRTLSNRYGYKFESNNSLKGMDASGHNSLSHLTLEIHTASRGVRLPDPKIDPVQLVFWRIDLDSFPIDIGISNEGIMTWTENADRGFVTRINDAAKTTPVAFYESEEEMLSGLADLVLLLDPDIISSFEVHSSSWGYLIERCTAVFDRDFCEEISRVKFKLFNSRRDAWGYSHDSGIHIAGRHTLNIWRLLRSGLNLLKYTLENIAFHVLHERLPHFSPAVLTSLWECSDDSTSLTTLLSYYKKRTEVNIRLLQTQQTINQTIEQARLIGIDFYSVISRGSQYKVESVLVRLCKSEHFLVLSPSKVQVREQKALECIPLVMEPESAFYKSPLVVLDFQSLYPSIMIGYNYCYSTILGRVHEMNLKKNEVGASKIDLTPGLLHELEDHLNISPNGVTYLKDSVRKSMLSKMLADILHTRLMVKTTMNDLKSKNETISKLLNNKQVALKLLANVTYGYTSASFSGRMPCSDVADSIVQTGRETLEKAISLIEGRSEWGAKVVYGDTDSLFVYLPGKSREEAFAYGKEMASAITACNPFPITLKFEKVYHPCILVSKKRYVGYSFEKENQKEPKFDAKGIETVRRDGHPAQQKIVEKALRILFETRNLSAVKNYIQDQFQKITRGQVSVQDFCFAKEVKLGSYKSDQTAPPGAVVATKKKALDHRAEPQYRERVSYVVIKGRPGQILRERCVPPEVFLSNDSFELDSTYYITKTLLPPLQRFFNLMGVDVSQWYFEMPRIQEISNYQEGKLPDFMRSTSCFNCKREMKERTKQFLCAECCAQKALTVSKLLQRDAAVKNNLNKVLKVCRSCCEPLTRNSQDDMSKVVTKCDSQDCPVYYSRIKYKCYASTAKTQRLLQILKDLDNW